MTVTIGAITDTPAAGDPIRSPWAQDVTEGIRHVFATKAALDAATAGWVGLADGAHAYTQDTDQVWDRVGGAWVGGWVTYTPVIRNDSTVVACTIADTWYSNRRGLCHYEGHAVATGAGAVGDINISLPVATLATTTNYLIGIVTFYDLSATAHSASLAYRSSAGDLRLIAPPSASFITTALAAGDVLAWNTTYRTA